MNLAGIDDREEYDWVYEQFKRRRPFWIGLNDMKHEGQFVSSDGCRRRYVRWDRREPNKQRNNKEDCVQMSSGNGWKDDQCTRKLNFLCKKSDGILRTKCGKLVFGK